jgi:hypothetical protein
MTIRIEMADMTLRELGAVADLLAPESLADAMQGPRQPYAMAALLCVIRQRDEPGFTYEQALDLRMSDFELVAPEDAGPLGDNNGAMQPSSAASGE